MGKGEKLFAILRNKKAAYFKILVGFCVSFFGVIFLYVNTVTPEAFLRWAGFFSIVSGAIVILLGIFHVGRPIISASSGGIFIAQFWGELFIPWREIKGIANETMGAMPGRFYSVTPCLVFEIQPAWKTPTVLSAPYLKVANKIYFASGSLSIPVDVAVGKLIALKNKC